MAKFKDAEVTVTLGGHRVTIKGDLEIVGDDFQKVDGDGKVADNHGTIAGALIVEDRSNAKLIEQLSHVETIEVDGESTDVLVSYNPLDASRVESPIVVEDQPVEEAKPATEPVGGPAAE